MISVGTKMRMRGGHHERGAMNTLIIPDVHERYDTLLSLRPLMDQATRVVMLGDFWDTYTPYGKAKVMAEWVKAHVHDPKFDILYGNHDCHYAFTNGMFMCTGFKHQTHQAIHNVMETDDWSQFQLYVKVGKYVVSHAGFHPKTTKLMEQASDAIDLAFAGEFHPLWSAGFARGGSQPVGGPTWLDWKEEFTPIEGMPQIVGHTHGPDVRFKSVPDGERSYCLDTGLKHVMWTDGDKVDVVCL